MNFSRSVKNSSKWIWIWSTFQYRMKIHRFLIEIRVTNFQLLYCPIGSPPFFFLYWFSRHSGSWILLHFELWPSFSPLQLFIFRNYGFLGDRFFYVFRYYRQLFPLYGACMCCPLTMYGLSILLIKVSSSGWVSIKPFYNTGFLSAKFSAY